MQITTTQTTSRKEIVRSRLLPELGDISNGVPANAGAILTDILDSLPPPKGYISVGRLIAELGEIDNQQMTVADLITHLRCFKRRSWVAKAWRKINGRA